jgi:hypothetical protein
MVPRSRPRQNGAALPQPRPRMNPRATQPSRKAAEEQGDEDSSCRGDSCARRRGPPQAAAACCRGQDGARMARLRERAVRDAPLQRTCRGQDRARMARPGFAAAPPADESAGYATKPQGGLRTGRRGQFLQGRFVRASARPAAGSRGMLPQSGPRQNGAAAWEGAARCALTRHKDAAATSCRGGSCAPLRGPPQAAAAWCRGQDRARGRGCVRGRFAMRRYSGHAAVKTAPEWRGCVGGRFAMRRFSGHAAVKTAPEGAAA